jgi:hypothetical protein
MKVSPLPRIVGALLLGLAAQAAVAQSRPPTTEQLGRDPGALRQEAEQQRAQQQRDEQRQSQQQADQQYNDTLRQQQSRAAGDMAQAQAVRRTWQQRPPLAAEKNPLLGRWESLGTGQRRGGAPGLSPEMAQLANALIGGITGGLCDSMLSRGTIEFRPAGLVAIGADGRERPMYRAEYRGGGARVVVLPQGGTTFTHMIIDFDGADHATVATVGCGLARAGGGGPARAAMASNSVAATDPGPPQQQWTLLGSSAANGGMDVYVAAASIRRSGDRARMYGLFDFKKRQAYEGEPFLSARNEFEYDCARPRQRMLGTTGYAGPMGKGAVIASSDGASPWEPVGTSGPAFAHWKVACGRR